MHLKLIVFIVLYIFIYKSYSQDTIKLDEVEIKDKVSLPYIKDIIDSRSIDQNSVKDIGEYLKNIPNVSGIKKGGTSLDPVVRGLKYSQLNVMPDNGVKVEGGCPNRMDPVSSHLEIENVERIEVIKGPFMLRYGPSFGGIINIITTKPEPYKKFEIHSKAIYSFQTNSNGQREHLSVFGGNNKVYFLLSGAYNKFGSYKDGNNNTVSSAFTKFDYSAKLGFTIDNKQSIMLSYISDHGRDVYYPALTMDEKSDNTNIMSFDYKAVNLSKNIASVDIKAYRSDVEHIMDNHHKLTYPAKDMQASAVAVNTGGRAEIGIKAGKNKLFVGIDYENISKDGERLMIMPMVMNMGNMKTIDTTKTNLWKDALIQNTGIFAEYHTNFDTYDFIASLRGDYNSANSKDTLKLIKEGKEYFDKTFSQFYNLSASIGATKRFNKNISLSISLGRGTRSPNMLERYIKYLTVGYDNFDYLGNPQLKPETNNQCDITLRYTVESMGSVYINGFYSYIQDYIAAFILTDFVEKPKTPGAKGVKQFYNTDYAIFRGFEIGYSSSDKYKLGITATAAYTRATINSASRYLYTGTQVTAQETLKNDALPEIPALEGRININYKFLSGKLIPNATVRLVNKQDYTSLAFYEPETPGYCIVDFSLNYIPIKYVNISAGVYNAFNKAYYEHLNRKIIGFETKLYEQGRAFFIKLILNI